MQRTFRSLSNPSEAFWRYQGGTQGSVPVPLDAAFGQYTLFWLAALLGLPAALRDLFGPGPHLVVEAYERFESVAAPGDVILRHLIFVRERQSAFQRLGILTYVE